ncbi:GNAT family N-acetyltransferase [Ollibium composti]|uniref:GNAT family N-acetyltransferase n=1 Tax=Ollibium composti TaxID=2675109 RepID=A0ABY2Q9J0_9HYPH|nr:GNAT family N-acetyltransferase [Mesorhizobium composti]THF58372.1 GNAT family N-acetyltransferase [Mesorhizobium composti]
MFVRTAGERDLEAIRALLVETWHATYDTIYGAAKVTEITGEWHSLARLKTRLVEPNSEFLVADDGEALAGVAFARAESKSVKLHQLYVRPAMQGRGVGGMLLDEIGGCFPEADKITLEVEPANERAVAFYVAQGFVKTGTVNDCGRQGFGIAANVYERPIRWAE